MSRRQFLNRTWVGGMLVFLGQFALASVDFLYPRRVTGFGAKITVDIQGLGLSDADEIKARLLSARTPEFISDGLGCSVPWCAPAKWFEAAHALP